MTLRSVWLTATALLFATASVSAQESNEELAMQLANPVAALTSVPFQFNYDQNIGPGNYGVRVKCQSRMTGIRGVAEASRSHGHAIGFPERIAAPLHGGVEQLTRCGRAKDQILTRQPFGS